LSGNRIPIEGRITAVADVYDALSSSRPYKQAFSLERSLKIMHEEIGKRFDPRVMAAFFHRIKDIERIRVEFSD
jgi:putative two-component system response regulator